MFEITNRTAAPYKSVCYIVSTWADGSQTRGSGVVIGVNDVLTAGHVVYDATRGGQAVKLTITPGADTSPFSAPFGSFTDVGVINSRTPNWDSNGDGLLTAEESQYDMAVIGLKSAIGNTTGWITPTNAAADFTGKMLGYPGRGTGLMEESVFADANARWSTYDIASALGPGASGGPLLKTDATGTYVAGVLSSGDAALTRSTYAGLFGAGNWEWLQSVMASNNSVMSSNSLGLTTFTGTAQADVLQGTAANETFVGNGGNDAITGGAGVDTAVYTGPRASYRITQSGTTLTVSDTVAARDGTDALTGIERLAFSDMTINLEIGAKAKTVSAGTLKSLEELYVGFFNRVPDADGLAFWIDQARAGKSVSAIAENFYAAAVQYPTQTGYTATMTNADFVNVIYRNVLGRSTGADAEGLGFWTTALANGSETRGTLVTKILASAHTFKGDATWGWVADLLDNKAVVANKFAVEMGLNYNTPEASITKGMEIAAAVSATGTGVALTLIGVLDGFVVA